MATFLAPGLQAAFDGCLAEALPADLAALLGRLDRPSAARRPHNREAAARRPRTPDSFQSS